eukprot:298813-Amphidinium_carterae.1
MSYTQHLFQYQLPVIIAYFCQVWMDDYAQLMKFATADLPAGMSLGDLAPRKELRQRQDQLTGMTPHQSYCSR